MINLKYCRFGDKLKTKGGEIVVYMGYVNPVDTEVYKSDGFHMIAGCCECKVGPYWIGSYEDDGIIIDKNGKCLGAGREENIVGIYRGSEIDLSRNSFGDRLATRCGSLALFLGYNEDTGFYEIEIIGSNTKKHETLSYNKYGEVNHSSLFQYDIIGKWEDC